MKEKSRWRKCFLSDSQHFPRVSVSFKEEEDNAMRWDIQAVMVCGSIIIKYGELAVVWDPSLLHQILSQFLIRVCMRCTHWLPSTSSTPRKKNKYSSNSTTQPTKCSTLEAKFNFCWTFILFHSPWTSSLTLFACTYMSMPSAIWWNLLNHLKFTIIETLNWTKSRGKVWC